MRVRLYAVLLVAAALGCSAVLEIQDEHLGVVLDTAEFETGMPQTDSFDLVDYKFLGVKMLDYPDIFTPEPFDLVKHQHIGLLGEASGKRSPLEEHVGEINAHLGLTPAQSGEVVHDLGEGLK